MIGNDIVDLATAATESNWKRKGYLEKIFTSSERFMIHVAKDAEILVWLLWTMKESVYKAAIDKSKAIFFSPSLFSCNNLILHQNTATADVGYDGKTYYCHSMLTQNYIHTIATAKQGMLKEVNLIISDYDAMDTSYKTSNPTSVSHHGAYLALVYSFPISEMPQKSETLSWGIHH